MLHFLRDLLKTVLLADLIVLFGGAALFQTTFAKFWMEHGWLVILLHLVSIAFFVITRINISRLHRSRPGQLDHEKGRQTLYRIERWRWFANRGMMVIPLLASTGMIFYSFFKREPIPISYTTAVTLGFTLLLVALSGSLMNTLLMDYLLYLRKLLSKNVQEVLREGRQPVLYLRSFKDDVVAADRDDHTLTEEEQLAKALERIGPLIALGKPDEALPITGAAREYVPLDDWQEPILTHMKMSRLVALRAGVSSSLDWEIQTAVQVLNPSQLIILVPFSKMEYDKFREHVQPFFPKWLPDHPGHLGWVEIGFGPNIIPQKFGSLLGVIRFEQDWTGHFEPIGVNGMVPVMRQNGSMMIYLMLHYALRPVYAGLGLVWEDPEGDPLLDFRPKHLRADAKSGLLAASPVKPPIEKNINIPQINQGATGCGPYLYLFLIGSLIFFAMSIFMFVGDINDIYSDVDLNAYQKIAQVTMNIVVPMILLQGGIFSIWLGNLISGENSNQHAASSGWGIYSFFLVNIAYLAVCALQLKNTVLTEGDQRSVLLFAAILLLAGTVVLVLLYYNFRKEPTIAREKEHFGTRSG